MINQQWLEPITKIVVNTVLQHTNSPLFLSFYDKAKGYYSLRLDVAVDYDIELTVESKDGAITFELKLINIENVEEVERSLVINSKDTVVNGLENTLKLLEDTLNEWKLYACTREKEIVATKELTNCLIGVNSKLELLPLPDKANISINVFDNEFDITYTTGDTEVVTGLLGDILTYVETVKIKVIKD